MNVIMIKIIVFWVMTPCSLVDGYQPCEGTCLPEKGRRRFLRNVSDHYYTTRYIIQKAAIQIVTAVETSDIT
jgi:hypothetical protein